MFIGKPSPWGAIQDEEQIAEGIVMFRVVDHPFNRAWYADLIGWVMANPPSFAIVERVS